MKTPQTKKELWAFLQEHMNFMRQSSNSFDNGYYSEAKRLAVTARVLLHDTQKSKSLLSQLKLLPGMGFYCTATPMSSEIIAGGNHRLVNIRTSETRATFHAPLDDFPPIPGINKIKFFQVWWNEPVIYTDKFKFKRRDIVLGLSNKLGGAHVDPNLDEAFAELIRDNPLGITSWTGNDEPQKIPDVELHTMRQISHEIFKSIQRKLAKG